MTPKITIAYVTARAHPRFEWFVDSLVRQTTQEERNHIQLVAIDSLCWSPDRARLFGVLEPGYVTPIFYQFRNDARVADFSAIIRDRFPDFLHIGPKPTAWQGPWRQTSRDFFCASNTRNTAFAVATHPYVVFVDDLSVLLPGWFDQVRHAAIDEYVVLGAYKKVLELKVDRGEVAHFRANLNENGADIGLDSRWSQGSSGGVVPFNGAALYGCSFGVPIEAALEIDGFDGIGNGAGFEDCDFGIRIERAGWPIFYNRNMCTLESEEDHHTGESPSKFRKIVTPDRLPKGYEGETWSDHVAINRVLRETDRIAPILGDGLREVRDLYRSTGGFPLPQPNQTDWRDGVLLKDL